MRSNHWNNLDENFLDALLVMIEEKVKARGGEPMFVDESCETQITLGMRIVTHTLRVRLPPIPIKMMASVDEHTRMTEINDVIDEWEKGFKKGKAHIEQLATDLNNHFKLFVEFRRPWNG